MGKLMVGLMRMLPLCVVVLVLPALVAAQCVSQLSLQRVWTQDAGGTDKSAFAPGEPIRIAAELNNSYGAYMLGANGAHLIITTSFYNDTKPIDIPPGISTWTWNVTAPSTESNYTVTVKVYDHFCGVFPEGSASFTIGQSSPPTTPLTFNVPATAEWVDTGLDVVAGDLLEVQAVGTWTDGGSTSGPEGSAEPWPDNFLNLTDLGACSVCARTLTQGHGALIGYIGDSPPAAGSYTSTAVRSEAVKVFYIGANFRGNVPFDGRLWLNKNADAYSGYTLDNSGSVAATVTMTTEPIGSGQSPMITLLGSDPLQHTQGCPFIGAGATATDAEDGDLTNSIIITGTENLDSPGPQTLTYSVTDSSVRSDVKTRQVMVFGVVGTPGCLFGKPEGKAPNLIVYVHGCCTDAADVNTLRTQFSEAYKGQAFLQKNGGWEIVVWDWTRCTSDPNVECTPKPPIWDVENFIRQGNTAYTYAFTEGKKLADAIENFPAYEYIHLIAHSAGAKLIHEASKWLAWYKLTKNEKRPFIHLTFLDAYTPNDTDTNSYGALAEYPEQAAYPDHYAEHFVDRTPSIIATWTNSLLSNAYNFDITDWIGADKGDPQTFGHSWPSYWYIQSITTPGFRYGYPLSLEGGYGRFDELSTVYGAGGCKRLPAIAVHLSVFEPGGQVLGNPSPPLFLSFVTEPTRSRCPERS